MTFVFINFARRVMRKPSFHVSLCFALFLVVTFVFMDAGEGEETDAHNYIGVKKCGMCHRSEKKGNQLAMWEKSAHAKAFETLKSEKAIAYARERGIETPHQSDACLKCHVTGHGEPAERFETGFVKEQGVQCESCHGAGSDYKGMGVMKDREAAVAAGLVIPTAETCVACHNEESPGFKGFDYEEYLAKIAHPNPSK